LADLLIPEFDKSNSVHKEIVRLQEDAAAAATKAKTSSGESARKEFEHQVSTLEEKIEKLALQLYGSEQPRKRAA
jgi:hypothetical protein